MQSFCIFSEIYEGGDGGNYKKGWGILVVPSTRAAVSRFVHLSAPFPQAGINTVPQATAVFTGIGAKSLFIPGRNRNAYNKRSKCTVNPAYNKTSSVHDNNETFLNTTVQIRNWQNANGGCPPTSCAHIQFMGKGKSCPSDEVFISAGINDSSGWYGKNPNYSGRRIRDNLRMKYPKSNFSLPSDSSCDLIGSKNIVGRLLNGVDVSKVCTEAASPANTKGEFVQLETSPRMRKKEYYEGWVEVFNQSFPPVNAAGMDIDDTDVWSE
ncbi:hypothetical protein AMATHDRAFT_5852 [Amanita thiersii Skay4041]|uniref:Uncharacterized protein n=1 Tax=Amanita thiersii Skay4041 TaxID=703135 RepID=A0A2A9NKU6_9AGAR|nr:hypothetical protein AMATHDRAFT_5852 [Amanita thiersii Skay4041]